MNLNETTHENWTLEHVQAVRYWTPTMLSFRTSRYRGFRFRPGHYARLGTTLTDGRTLWRPYSIVSASYDEYLEFLATLVPGGEFSARLASLKAGDVLQVDKSCFGFLTVDQLAPGNDLWLLASGSGLGPMLSILRDPAVWSRFRRLLVVHSVRQSAELAYRAEIEALSSDPLLVEGGAQLTYLPVVTRQPGATALSRRLPELLADGSLETAAACPLSVESSRLMICGNPEMAVALRKQLTQRGFVTGRRGIPGQMAFENYW